MTTYSGVPPQLDEPDAWLELFGDRALSKAVSQPTEALGTPLPLYQRRTHGLVGKGESCKSLVLGHCALTVAARGGHVILLDGEMSAGRWRERIEAMGARYRPEALDRIAYLSMRDPDALGIIRAVAPAITLIGVDSLAKYLSRQVDNENNNVAVTKAIDPWIALAAKGPAIAFVDHASASAEVMVSRGATAKFNDLDVSYGFKLDAGTAPNRQFPWRVRVTVEKDRDGLIGHRLDRVITFTPGIDDLGLAYSEPEGESHRLAVDPLEAALQKIAALDPPPTSGNDAFRRIGGTRRVALDAFARWRND